MLRYLLRRDQPPAASITTAPTMSASSPSTPPASPPPISSASSSATSVTSTPPEGSSTGPQYTKGHAGNPSSTSGGATPFPGSSPTYSSPPTTSPPDATSSSLYASYTKPSESRNPSHTLSSGAIAGVVISTLLGVALVVVGLYLLWRRGRRGAAAKQYPSPSHIGWFTRTSRSRYPGTPASSLLTYARD